MSRSESPAVRRRTARTLALLLAMTAAGWAAARHVGAEDATTLVEVAFTIYQNEGAPPRTLREVSDGEWRSGEAVFTRLSASGEDLVLLTADRQWTLKVDLGQKKVFGRSAVEPSEWQAMGDITNVVHRPVAGLARVTVINRSGQTGLAATFDPERRIWLDAQGWSVAPGESGILESYVGRQWRISTAEGRVLHTFTVARDGQTEQTPIESVAISFLVRDGSGHPLAGATLEVQALEGQARGARLTGETAANGVVTFSLMPGSYGATASMPGYQPQSQRIGVGSTDQGFAFALERAPPTETDVYYVVHDVRGRDARLAGASIEILGLDGQGRPSGFKVTGTTDAGGTFQFALVPGAYVATVTLEGYAGTQQRFQVGPEPQPVLHALRPLPPAQTEIQVRVVDAGPGARPLAGVKLEVGEAREDGAVVARGVTNARGLCSFSLRPGSYGVTAALDGYEWVTLPIDVGSDRRTYPFPLTRLAPEKTDIAYIVLDAGAGGTRLAGAKLEIQGLDASGRPSGERTSATTDPAGVSRLSLVPGRYRMTAALEGYTSSSQEIEVGATPKEYPHELSRVPPTETRVEFRVHVSAGAQEPLAGAAVTVLRLAPDGTPTDVRASVTTDAAGHCALSLLPGTYDLTASMSGFRPLAMKLAVGRAARAYPLALEPLPPEKTDVTYAVFDAQVREQGRDDLPLVGASVEIQGLDGDGVPTGWQTAGTTDADGTWASALQPGRYGVTVALAGYDSTSRPIEVGAQPVVFEHLLRKLAPPEAQVAIVLSVAGAPDRRLGGATVDVVRLDAQAAPPGPVLRGTTDGEGTFAFTLPPGRYTVTGSMPGYARRTLGLEVASSEVRLDLALRSAEVEPAPPAPAPLEPVPAEPAAPDAPVAAGVDVLFRRLDVTADGILDSADLAPVAWRALKRVLGKSDDAGLPAPAFRALLEAARERIRRELQTPLPAAVPTARPFDIFTTLDRDQDGFLSERDLSAAAWAGLKTLLGRSGDEPFTRPAFLEGLSKVPPPAPTPGPGAPPPTPGPSTQEGALVGLLRHMDRNGDGRVDRADFSGPTWRTLVDLKIDRDGDGVLSLEELRLLGK